MKIEDKVISLELAKKFDAFGLRNITSENIYIVRGDSHYLRKRAFDQVEPSYTIYPAYDVAEIGDMLPSEIKGKSTMFTLKMQNYYGEWCLWYENEFGDHMKNMYFSENSMIRCVEQVPIRLIKEGHVTVEELNQEKGR